MPFAFPPESVFAFAGIRKMAGAARSDIEVLRVASVYAAQQHAQRVCLLRQDDQMNVVGHEAPAEQTDWRVSQVVAQQSQVGVTIEVGLKNGTAVDTALRDMVRDAVEDAALSSWHNLCVR